ncbi:transposase [Mucilaginibacter rigui]|uniref:transposase n=1 Tax=Mucilaginibacter rigui TaxID=534635 RepID=UPI001CD09394
MSELRKANSDRPFFLTLPVVGWIDVFTRNDYCDEFIRNLEYCRKNKGLKVYAYCIMSNHIHLIAAHNDGKLPDVIRDLKSYTAKRIIERISNNLQESRKEWLLYLFNFLRTIPAKTAHISFGKKQVSQLNYTHPKYLIRK